MTVADVAPEAAPAETSPQPGAASAASLDRTISPIAGRFGGGTAGKAVTLAALVAGCGAFVLATGHHAPAKPKSPEAPAAQVVPFEAAKPNSAPTLANPGAGAPALDPTAAANAGQVPALSTAAGTPGASSAQAAAQAAAQARVAQIQAIRGATILAFSQGGGPTPGAPSLAATLLPASAEAAHTPTESRSTAAGFDHWLGQGQPPARSALSHHGGHLDPLYPTDRDGGVTRRSVQNRTLSGQGLEHKTNLA